MDSLTVEPSSLTYTAGDSFNFGAGKITTVTAGYTDGNDKEININDCDLTITPLNGGTPETVDKDYRFMTEGSYTLTVSFGGKDANVAITVNPATVTGIKVTTQPTRTTYFDGESFAPAGMIVSKVYSNGTTEEVTGYTCSPETVTKDNTKVTITYGELETTVEVTVLDTADSYQNGTYSIATAEGLQAWNQAALNDLSINCTLTADINLTGKEEWTPIGTESQPYTGTFDGNNYTITGLTVNQTRNYVGLIGCIGSDGTVKNVKLENVNITGDGYFVGGVAGTNYGTIENCSVDGTLTNNRHYLGGVVGNNYGSIIGCSSSGTITGTSPNVGGIGGQSVGGTIMACYSVANIKGWSSSGGVLGQTNRETVVIACYHANGNVTGEQSRWIGGVIGWNYGKVTACYWGNNGQAQGIGENQAFTDGTTMVDGQSVTWQTAVTQMNAALQSAGSQWRYNETTGTLIKP